MKKVTSIFVFGMLLLVIGCKTNDKNTDPKLVLQNFMDALVKKDFEAARKLSTEKSKTMINMMERALQSGEKAERAFNKYDKSKMEFGTAKIDSMKAVVPVKDLVTGETLNYPLYKENGDWKVAFDLESLMSTITEPMKKSNSTDPGGSIKLPYKERNINVDSVTKEMHRGMHDLDSVSKALEKMQ